MLRNNKAKTFFYLAIILILAAVLRIIFLDVIPNGFFLDEASDGYDAYSLLETGRDKYGSFLPLFLTGIGTDFREALYVFSTVPFIKIFGVNEFATRFPAALFGTANVLVIYFLAKELFNKKVGLLAALCLAISPWHIQFSRIAFRSILLPLLFSLALLFFVKSFKKPKYLVVSGFLFGVSLYTYSSSRVFIPLFCMGLVLIFCRHIWSNKKEAMLGIILFLSILIPLFIVWISPEGMIRANNVGIERNPLGLLQNYLSYFQPDFLFFTGDKEPRHSPVGIGELNYFELITISVGIVTLWFCKHKSKEKAILTLWFLLYPIPAAITEPGHATRALIGTVLFAILSAYGLARILDFITSRKSIKIASVILLVTVSLAIFWKRYFIDYPLYANGNWQYGFREAITYAEKTSPECVIMTYQEYHNFSIKSFSVFIPFYTKYPPQKYQQNPLKSWLRNPEEVYSIGKYTLMTIPETGELNQKCLYIIHPTKINEITSKGYQLKVIHIVKDARGIEFFRLAELIKNVKL